MSGCEDMPFDLDGENANPNSGRQTPINHLRRPGQTNKSWKDTALSPTKRRKQSHVEESPVRDLKLASPKDDAVCAASPRRPDRESFSLWFEVFSRLGHKDVIDNAARACKLWHEVAHSKELWFRLHGHLSLCDQLLIAEKVVERRSKGRLFKCRRLGSGEAVLLRVVDLELTNAGKDDGMPTSFLREAALLSELRHPNIIRHIGSEIIGKKAVMCTEFVHESFGTWTKRLDMFSSFERVIDIRVKFRQVLTGLSYVHHQGIMHRNLKPDNLFIDLQGTVKIGDFTTTRMLDIPFQAYTPEDPKERDRSGREMRRLWYRAPELILRDEIYGPKVDMWSLGCLLAEAASGRPLFQSDSEIDHLFRVFRLVGTPTPASWPEVITMKNFSPKFPIYSGFNLAQVARAKCCGSVVDQEALLQNAQSDRSEILQHLFAVSSVLGPDGMLVLDRLVTVPPSSRAGCETTLDSPFFKEPTPLPTLRTQGFHPVVQQWLHGRQATLGDSSERRSHSRMDDAPPGVIPGTIDEPLDADCPPVSVPSSLIPSHMVWNILTMMQQQEQHRSSSSEAGLRRLPPGFDAGHRAVLVDFIVGLANTLNLRDNTTHLACAVVDKYLAMQTQPIPADRLQVVGATCLKLSDVFAEQSKEYYKQENTVEYAEATLHQMSSAQMLQCEKELLPKLDFKLQQPTIHWFLQCYLAYGRFTAAGQIGKRACFISDLMLLDYELLEYTPSLKAQCALLLAVFLAQEALYAKQRKSSADKASEEVSVAAAGARYLAHWDEHVRDRVCSANTAVETSMCLQAVVKTLVEKRREWKSVKLTAAETKHAALGRAMVYPERFPVSKLVRYILPNNQRGLIPE